MDKRTFIKSVLLGAAGVFATGFRSKLKALETRQKWDGIYRIPELPYAFSALEPYIDEETMKLHYLQHHAAYAKNLNRIVREAGYDRISAYEFLMNSSHYSASIIENAGGFMNHRLFWKMMTPVQGKQPSFELSSALTRDFGSFETFKSAFNKEAGSVFGSGWAWLIVDNSGKLHVTSTRDQNNPIMDTAEKRGFPILCLDVWEHAYYMQNQNRRSDYIDDFWNILDWDFVSKKYNQSKKVKIG